jgi:hypothetical protein
MTSEFEDSVAGFLGVQIERNQSDSSIKLTQVGLIKRIVAALGIEQEPTVHTPTSPTYWKRMLTEILSMESSAFSLLFERVFGSS